jgi:hypothetical protein
MSLDDYLKSIGADPNNLSKEEQAQVAAFTAFGPQQDVGGLRGSDIFNLVAASQMGRGAPDYVRTALNIRSAENERKRLINQQRGELIEKFLEDPEYEYATLINVKAAQNNQNPYVVGRILKGEATAEVMQPDGSFKFAGPDYIVKTGVGDVDIPESPNVKLMADIYDPIYEKEKTATGLISIYTPLREQLMSLGPEDITPGTVTSAMAGLVNQGVIEFNNISKIVGGNIFASDADVAAGTAGMTGDRAGLGTASKGLYNDLSKGDVSTDSQSFKEFETMIEGETGKSLNEILGDTVYNDVRLRSRFLQLAYVAAAINGQTGRTLSDKDLAYHIQIVGLGQTSDPKVLIRNLDSFVNDSINAIDNDVKLAISQNFPKIAPQLDDTYVQSHLADFYAPNTPNVYSRTLDGYTFRDFGTRRPGLGIASFTQTVPSATLNMNTTFDYDEALNKF